MLDVNQRSPRVLSCGVIHVFEHNVITCYLSLQDSNSVWNIVIHNNFETSLSTLDWHHGVIGSINITFENVTIGKNLLTSTPTRIKAVAPSGVM